MIFAPIIARTFSPEAYGEFAIFNVLFTNLALIATLSYPSSLPSIRDGSSYFSLSLFILILLAFFSGLFSIVYYGFFGILQSTAGGILQPYWGWLIPCTVIFQCLVQLVSIWNLRTSHMRLNFLGSSAGQLGSRGLVIGWGISISNSGLGLILGEISKNLINLGGILRKPILYRIRQKLSQLNGYSLKRSFAIGRKLKNYPKLVFPGLWVNQFSNQLPLYFITIQFSDTALGAYALAGSMVAIPHKLIGLAISPVFHNKSQEILDQSGTQHMHTFTKKVMLGLLFVGVIPFALLYGFGADIFSFVFGADWELAGKIASVLSFQYWVAFAASPVATVFYSLHRQQALLKFQVFLFSLRVVALGIAWFLRTDMLQSLLIYSVINAIGYGILLLLTNYILKDGQRKAS